MLMENICVAGIAIPDKEIPGITAEVSYSSMRCCFVISGLCYRLFPNCRLHRDGPLSWHNRMYMKLRYGIKRTQPYTYYAIYPSHISISFRFWRKDIDIKDENSQQMLRVMAPNAVAVIFLINSHPFVVSITAK